MRETGRAFDTAISCYKAGPQQAMRSCGKFHDAGLLDKLIVQVGSVTLGQGQPLLPRRIAFPPMKLLSVQQIGAGLAELRYEFPKSTGKEGPSP